jgi:hypothetical protein
MAFRFRSPFDFTTRQSEFGFSGRRLTVFNCAFAFNVEHSTVINDPAFNLNAPSLLPLYFAVSPDSRKPPSAPIAVVGPPRKLARMNVFMLSSGSPSHSSLGHVLISPLTTLMHHRPRPTLRAPANRALAKPVPVVTHPPIHRLGVPADTGTHTADAGPAVKSQYQQPVAWSSRRERFTWARSRQLSCDAKCQRDCLLLRVSEST